MRFNEISDEKKYNEEDIDYVQKEFNELVLVDGYASLFDYLKLKEFVKLLMEETK